MSSPRPIDQHAQEFLSNPLFDLPKTTAHVGHAIEAAAAAKKRNISVLAEGEYAQESCWETPENLVALVTATLGFIDLDPCTTQKNPTRARRFYWPEVDGYSKPWDAETIYLNPPYGRTIGHWVERLVATVESGTRSIALVPARQDVAWYHKLLAASSSMFLFRGRIKFRDPKTDKATSTGMFPSTAFGLNVSLKSWEDALPGCEVPLR